jgi:hypothetical protein
MLDIIQQLEKPSLQILKISDIDELDMLNPINKLISVIKEENSQIDSLLKTITNKLTELMSFNKE